MAQSIGVWVLVAIIAAVWFCRRELKGWLRWMGTAWQSGQPASQSDVDALRREVAEDREAFQHERDMWEVHAGGPEAVKATFDAMQKQIDELRQQVADKERKPVRATPRTWTQTKREIEQGMQGGGL